MTQDGMRSLSCMFSGAMLRLKQKSHGVKVITAMV